MEAHLAELVRTCVKLYNDRMEHVTDNTSSFISNKKLKQFHEKTNSETMTKFSNEKRCNDNSLTNSHQTSLETEVSKCYQRLMNQNDHKRNCQIAQYGEWAHFSKLAKLDINWSNGFSSGDGPILYANSKHKIDIIVTIGIRNDEDEKLNLTPNDFKGKLYLCEYETGIRITSPWKLHNDEKNKTNGPNENTIKLYRFISCENCDFDSVPITFAIGLDVPGIGHFDTSRDGASTKNMRPFSKESGSEFKCPKSITFKVRRKIDYSIQTNISIFGGGLETIGKRGGWTSRLETGGPYKEHANDITCKRRRVSIRPNKSNTGQENFKSYQIYKYPIKNENVNKRRRVWTMGFWDYENCFQMITEEGEPPLAVLCCDYDIQTDYQINFWFEGKKKYKIDGHCWTCDNSYFYRICPYLSEDDTGSDSARGAVPFVLYKFIHPENRTRKHGWENECSPVKVKVTDFYENEGTFDLIFNSDGNYDMPVLA